MLYLFFELEILYRDSQITTKHFIAQTPFVKTKNLGPRVIWMKILFIFYQLWRYFGSNFGLGCGQIFVWYRLYFRQITTNYFWNLICCNFPFERCFFWVFKKQLQKAEKLAVAKELKCPPPPQTPRPPAAF